jgi:rare lipoprotein A
VIVRGSSRAKVFWFFFSKKNILFLCLAFAGCMKAPPPAPKLVAHPHYELGRPYEADGHWYYPEENFSLDATGLADVAPDQTGLTADGEIFDGSALTASMQTIQLPAVATVTNLQNGRQVQVRVNDRGPADPGRLIGLSARAAQLLLIPAGGVARVRVQVDTVLSHRVVDQVGGGPQLDIKTAPRGVVLAVNLPPPSVGGGAAGGHGAVRVIGAPVAEARGPVVPDRMPEVVHAVAPAPGELWLRAGSFARYEYANMLAAKLAGLGGDVLRSRDGRQTVFAVRAGPFRTVAEADAALRRALGAGVVDARITVEE